MLWGRMRTALEAPEAFAASSYCCCAVIVNEMRQEKGHSLLSDSAQKDFPNAVVGSISFY
jgi:hypothetical protein